MKLAEALITRKEMYRKLSLLAERIQKNIIIQEGDEPVEDPNALMPELERLSQEVTELVQRINATNASTRLENGMTIAQALAKRDELIRLAGFFRSFADMGREGQVERYSKSEIKRVCTIDVAATEHKADELAKEARELDMAIQALNWQVEL